MLSPENVPGRLRQGPGAWRTSFRHVPPVTQATARRSGQTWPQSGWQLPEEVDVPGCAHVRAGENGATVTYRDTNRHLAAGDSPKARTDASGDVIPGGAPIRVGGDCAPRGIRVYIERPAHGNAAPAAVQVTPCRSGLHEIEIARRASWASPDPV